MKRLLMKRLLFLGLVPVLAIAAYLQVSQQPSTVAAATSSPLACSPTTDSFLESVCSLAGLSDWHAISVATTDVGPTPQMYARFARAVANADPTICDDAAALLFIEAGSHVSKAEAQGICQKYVAERIAAGWFEVADPATGNVVRVEVTK